MPSQVTRTRMTVAPASLGFEIDDVAIYDTGRHVETPVTVTAVNGHIHLVEGMVVGVRQVLDDHRCFP